MHRLHNPVRPYAWGSTWHIPRLAGLPVADEPAAEMWFGAHPSAPSRTSDDIGLDQLILDAPERCLGTTVLDTFGPRLPFLMKLLAAAEPLSLQVHPTSERAQQRFREQNAAGVPPDAAERSYPDASHKPELVFALTRFEGMAGFRDVAKTAQILRMLQLPWLDRVADRLDASSAPSQTLREVVTDLLAQSGHGLRTRLQELLLAAVSAQARFQRPTLRVRPPEVDPSSIERESLRVFAQTAELVNRYPDDPGVLVTLFLNHVVLAAGEAMFIAAGTMHAYTSGFAVEVMAASDNVLRAGLTPKHVDKAELLDITDFTPMPPPRFPAEQLGGLDCVLLAPPVEEFELVVATAAPGDSLPSAAGPAIVLCLAGEVTVGTGDVAQQLTPGEAVFVEAADGPATVTGDGRAAVVRAPVAGGPSGSATRRSGGLAAPARGQTLGAQSRPSGPSSP